MNNHLKMSFIETNDFLSEKNNNGLINNNSIKILIFMRIIIKTNQDICQKCTTNTFILK